MGLVDLFQQIRLTNEQCFQLNKLFTVFCN